MAHIEIEPAPGVWTVRTADGVLGETRRALLLREGGHDPVVYFPVEDVAMALLERSATTTRCPHKGAAEHYHYVGASARIDDVAWCYAAPDRAAAEPIAGHLAFYDGKVTVEEL